MTAMQYSNLTAVYFYPYAIMQIPSGILADTLGARKTGVIGCLTMAVGSILFGIAPGFSMLMFGRMLVGLGASVIFLSILKIQSTWFAESEFGTLTGMTTFAGNLGGAVAQGPLAMMVGLLTWRMSFIAIGIFSAFLAVLIFVLVRNKPEDKGFEPIVAVRKETQQKQAGIWQTLKEIVLCRHMWPIIIINFGDGCELYHYGLGAALFDRRLWTQCEQGRRHYLFYPLGAAVGCIVTGAITDKIKMRKLPAIFMSVGAIVCLVLITFLNGGKAPLPVFAVCLILISVFDLYGVVLRIVKGYQSSELFGHVHVGAQCGGLCRGGGGAAGLWRCYQQISADFGKPGRLSKDVFGVFGGVGDMHGFKLLFTGNKLSKQV